MDFQFQGIAQDLRLTIHSEPFSYTVEMNGHEWNSLPSFQPYFEYLLPEERVTASSVTPGNLTMRMYSGRRINFDQAGQIAYEPFTSGLGAGLRMVYRAFPGIAFEFETRLWLEMATDAFHCDFISLVDDPGVLKVVWPAPFELPAAHPEGYTVLPMMQGCLLPNHWPEETHLVGATGLFYTRAAYMPWWGQVDQPNANIAIVDTPWDGGYSLDHPAGGPSLVQPVWFASLGGMRYQRQLHYQFVKGDYNDLCKVYRRHVMERGGLRKLEEKARENRAVARLIGSPVVHTSIYYHTQPESVYYNREKPEANDILTPFGMRAQQFKELSAKGVKRAYVHLDGWGKRGYDNLHPDVLPPCEEAGGWEGMRSLLETCHNLGYLLALHDQYRDYYQDAASFHIDQAVQDDAGEVPSEAVWAGGAQSFLCASLAPGYVRRNYLTFEKEGLYFDGSYLDVFAVVDLDECYHPEHRMTRKECLEYRAACLSFLRGKRMLASSEESIGWAVPYLDLVHHGPYALLPDLDKGHARGIPVPLFNLVYHDCLILPWSLTLGGWGLPDHDSGLLHAYLNGGTGYLAIDAEREEIERVLALCAFQERVAYAEMLRHEFIDGNLRRQRTTFLNGLAVEVDFDQQTFQISQ